MNVTPILNLCDLMPDISSHRQEVWIEVSTNVFKDCFVGCPVLYFMLGWAIHTLSPAHTRLVTLEGHCSLLVISGKAVYRDWWLVRTVKYAKQRWLSSSPLFWCKFTLLYNWWSFLTFFILHIKRFWAYLSAKA